MLPPIDPSKLGGPFNLATGQRPEEVETKPAFHPALGYLKPGEGPA